MSNHGSKEVITRLQEYQKQIDKEFPDMNTEDKAFKLLRILTDNMDIEGINTFSRVMGNVSKEHDNKFYVRICKLLKNATTRAIFLEDQKKDK